jgi:hypothetical protein
MLENTANLLKYYLILVSLFLAIFAQQAHAAGENIAKIVDSGDPPTHIDIAILGSGFAQGEIDSYITKVDQNINKMFAVNWFSSNRYLFNVWRIDAISQQSGTDLDDASIFGIASQTPYDILVVIHNYDGQESVQKPYIELYKYSNNYFVLGHELGHTIGKLDDEYWTPATAYKCDGLSKRTLNIHDKPNNEKWSDLIFSMPYEGARYCGQGLWRPSDNSIMRDSANSNYFDTVGLKAMDLGAGKILGTIESNAPSLQIVGVKNGDVKGGLLNVEAVTSDTSGIERVEFYWAKEGETSKSIKIDKTYPYDIPIDTTQYADGQYYLDTLSYDRNWNYVRKTVLFSIQNQSLGAVRIPLHIRDVAGVGRVSEPCSTGVPLPIGLLRLPTGIAVYDSSNNAVPAQFKVLERWREHGQPDSIKWLLVTFLADVPANGQVDYYLAQGNNPAPIAPVDVIDIGTGFQMAGQTFMKDFSSPFKLILTEPNGITTHQASDLNTITWTVEENGPVRTLIRAESQTEPGRFGFIAWIYGYAGIKQWDMTLVLKNTPKSAQGPFYFKDFSLMWDTPGTQYTLGGEPGHVVSGTVASGESVYLYQDSSGTDKWSKLGEHGDGRAGYVIDWTSLWIQGTPDFRGYKIKWGGTDIGGGNHALGWATLENAAVAVRHFWQQYPKALEIEQNKIIVRLWPRYWNGHGGIHWLDDLQRKAHDISFRLGGFSEASAKAFNYPLVVHCGLDWYRTAGANGHISSRYTETQPNLLNLGDWEYNWVNFGGYYLDRIRRRIHWYTMDEFIRTSDPYHAHQMWLAMRHSVGMTPLWVDDYQFPADSGVMSPVTYTNPARPKGTYTAVSDHHSYMPWNPQHWTSWELFDSWRLFGDPLAYDAIQQMGTYLQFWVEHRKTHGINESRLDSLPMSTLCEAYRITENQSILKSMQDYLDIIWSTINKERGYYVPNLAFHPPAGTEKPFMVSRLIDGLRDYYSISGDERAFDMGIGLTDYAIDEGYVNGCYGFLYETPIDPSLRDQLLQQAMNSAKATSCNEWTSVQQMTRPLAWSYLNTGESKYKKVFDEVVQGAKSTTYYAAMLGYQSWLDWGEICDEMEEVQRGDEVPPQPVADLSAAAAGSNTVRLNWTAPAAAVRYQIKFSNLPMVDRISWPDQVGVYANWWAATNVVGEPIPASEGSQETFTVTGLKAGTYYFAIRSYDPNSNQSPLSNMASAVVVGTEGVAPPNPPSNLKIIDTLGGS